MTTTAAGPVLLEDGSLHEALRAFVGERASRVDSCDVQLREGIAHLADLGLIDLGIYERDTPEQFMRMCEVVGTVALDCMSQAFATWCHRMATEYINQADLSSPVRDRFIEGLRGGQVLGSTSFASATAHFLAGTPLPLTFRRTPEGLRVSGRVAWASNLQPPFVSIAAAANVDDPNDRVVFAFHEDTPGLTLPAYPEILALQATNSTSPLFEDALVLEDEVLTRDFDRFVARILPTFLLLQSSFCWGLSARALAEAEAQLQGPREVLRGPYDELRQRFDSAQDRLRSFATHPHREELAHRDLLQLRLDFGRLTVESVAIEAKLAGGRGYMLHSGTARRLREAAFLPVQAPTEVQLQWLLARYE